MNIIKFEVDRIQLLEEISNSQFAKARLWCFASGDNSHNLPVSEEALIRAEKTIYGKPLIYAYSAVTDDALAHEKHQIPCGFVPQQNANISYERVEDGRLFFVCDCLIWKYYSGKVLEIFERTDGKKSISVEIQVVEIKEEDEKKEIVDFIYMAITILGEKYTPAIPLAHAQIVQFSNDKLEVERLLNYKDNATKEVEVVVFNKDDFSKSFSMTANEMWEMLSNATCEVKYQEDGEDYQYTRYWMRDYNESYIFAYDYMKNKLCAIPYSMTDGKAVLDFENVKNAKQSYIITEEVDSEDMMEFAKKIMAKELAKYANMEKEFSAQSEKISALEVEYQEKFNKIEQEKTELSSKFSVIEEENKSLKEFKENIEQQEFTGKVEFAINEVSDVLSSDQVNEWRGKVSEYKNIEEFSNAIQAFAFSITKGKKQPEGFTRMSIPNTTKEEVKKSVWDNFIKN